MNSSKLDTPDFDPRDPAYRGKLWVSLNSEHGQLRHIFWPRILRLGLAILGLGWVAATGAVWANLRLRRGFQEIHYLDLAVPWRWPRYVSAMSGHYVAMGNAALQRGDPNAAFYFYTASLALRPADPETRRLAALAQFRLGLRRAALAALESELPAAAAAHDEAYLRQFFTMAFSLRADEEAYRVGQPLLPIGPTENRADLFIAFQLAVAQFNRGRYEEAEQILSNWNLRNFPDGLVLYAQCQWESGHAADALETLQGGLAHFAQRRDGIYAALEQIARTEKQPEEELHYAILRQLDDPEHPAPQLDVIYAAHRLGRTAQERRLLAGYCAAFKSDPAALSQLTQFAIETGQPQVAESVRALIQAGGHSVAIFDLGVAEAALNARDYPAATAALNRIKADQAPPNRSFNATLEGARLVAKFGTEDTTAPAAFARFLPAASALRPPESLLLARDLGALGQPELGRQVLERIDSSNPDAEEALIELVREETAAKDQAKLTEYLPALIKLRKVPKDVLAAALPLLGRPEDAPLRDRVRALIDRSPARYLSTQR